MIGFTLGKFLPFHKGHKAMIRFGLSKCEQLTVIVCASDLEKVPGHIRQNWIQQTFYQEVNAGVLNVIVYDYLEKDLSASSEASIDVTGNWAEAFMDAGYNKENFDVIISSEDYGELMADLMNMKHISFDKGRELVPVSATAIRQNLFGNWQYLPPAVREYFAIKVVIVGTESTGKTTLAKRLAEKYRGVFVPEAGRDLIPTSESFTMDDLYNVQHEHQKYIDKAIAFGDSPLILIDTDWHITKSYGKFAFGRGTFFGINRPSKGDLYLYLTNNVPFVQDGTRLSEDRRNALDISHREVLGEHKTTFKEITGTDWDARFFEASIAVMQLIQEKLSTVAHLLGK